MILELSGFELRRMFHSPATWLILAISQLVMALTFYNLLSAYLSQPALFEGRGLTEVVVSGYYQAIALLIVLLTPLLTMRLFSEEFRYGTIRLLLSSPVSLTRLVLGKYLAIVLFMGCLLLLASLVPASLAVGTELDYGHFAAGVTGIMLLICSLTAIGLFVSTLFRYPGVAAVTTFAVLFLFWTVHTAANGQGTYELFNYLSMSRHFNRFNQGVFSTEDFSYFIIITVLFISLGIWRLDRLRTQHW